MRIRWRGLELPTRIVADPETLSATYGRFVIEPFERGYGVTIGNSLRRVLLSSIEGAAVTSVNFAGVPHEFTAIEGVYEDVADIILNIKCLAVRILDDNTHTVRLSKDEAGEMAGSDIECDPGVEIVSTDLHIATLTADVPFDLRMTVSKGRGYVTADENEQMLKDKDINTIAVDSGFSPVTRVRYTTENTRVGQKTNYDRLILEIWTDGSISPEMSLVEAAKILRKHLNPFVQYFEQGPEVPSEDRIEKEYELPVGPDEKRQELLAEPISVLGLTVRAQNCLEGAGVDTVGRLLEYTEDQLLEIRNLGKTTLDEIVAKLAGRNLSLSPSADSAAVAAGESNEA